MNIRPTVLALAASVVTSGAALAQPSPSPYYIGIAQDVTHQSNVLGSLPGSELSDTVYTTTLRGGLNLPFGRQRAYANVALNHQRYGDLDSRDNNGYTVGAGIDWSTIERLSGSLVMNANRRQAGFNVGGIVPVTLSNIERSEDVTARVRLGVVTLFALEAAAGQRRLSFSAPEYAAREYKQDSGSLGISYRPSAILTLGAGVDAQRTRFLAPAAGQTAPDRNDRNDVYLTANWVPTGASTVNARVNSGKTEYDRGTAANFKGVTGSLVWAWRPTGLLNLTTTLARETGQEIGFVRLAEGATVLGTDFSQVSDRLSLRGDYELTGKISLSGGLGYARRSLVDGFTGVPGSDKTTTWTLGARWAATRTLSFGCDASRESRAASGAGSGDYDNNTFGCFGQFTLD